MNSKYDVSVVIINYNSKKYIDNLFDSLVKLKHDDFTYQIVVVDNASTDDSMEYLRGKGYDQYMDIKLVKSDKNRGFAGGNNLGVSQADGEYVVFLNNDTAVDENWLSELYHFIKSQDNCVMANSKLLFFYDYIDFTFKTSDKIELDRNIMINSHEHYADGKFITNCLCEEDKLVCFGHTDVKLPLLDKDEATVFEFKTKTWNKDTDRIIFNGKEYEAVDGVVRIELAKDDVINNKITLIQNAGSGIDNVYNGYDIGFCKPDGPEFEKPYEINNGCGAAIIMKKSDFVNCGGFDEQFFMYYEDTDLSYRMKANGGKIMFCPTSIVRHIHTGSSTEWSPFFTYHVYRNKLLFLYKNFDKKIFKKYYFRQYLEGIRYRDNNKIRGCRDAKRIAVKKETGIHF
ncbi:MAG: glycosyltransferase family 2 protein [Lachnospira sp.]